MSTLWTDSDYILFLLLSQYFAPIFWDGKGLIYLAKVTDSRYMKIAVDVNLKTGTHRGIRLPLSKVDTMYLLDISTEIDRGLDEFNRIMCMKQIR